MWTVVVRDPQGKEVKRLPLNGRLVVGRTPQCEILIDSTAVSRQHARIELFQDKPVFVDLGSSNGSLLNGQAVTKPMLVDERHTIEIAGHRISFERPGVKIPVAPDDDDSDRTVMMSSRPSASAAGVPPPAAPVEDDLDLVPMRQPSMPSAPKPSTTPEFELPEIKVPERAGPGSTKDINWNSATDVFDQQLKGIRAHREETQRGTATRLQQLEAEWAETVVTIRALQTKLSGNPKVLHFVISRDQKEVSIKIADTAEKRGYRYFVFSRHHPEGQYPGLDAVWLREFGSDDTSYKEPKKAMQELVQRIAGTFA